MDEILGSKARWLSCQEGRNSGRIKVAAAGAKPRAVKGSHDSSSSFLPSTPQTHPLHPLLSISRHVGETSLDHPHLNVRYSALRRERGACLVPPVETLLSVDTCQDVSAQPVRLSWALRYPNSSPAWSGARRTFEY